jgi:branched-chain amino acid transport system substrate-binding protein
MQSKRMLSGRVGGALFAVMLLLAGTISARAENPITIGFGMALTGGLAPNGKAALFAMQIWEKEINAKGGLGR